MADAFFTERAPHDRDDVVRRHSGGLVHDENPVHRSPPFPGSGSAKLRRDGLDDRVRIRSFGGEPGRERVSAATERFAHGADVRDAFRAHRDLVGAVGQLLQDARDLGDVGRPHDVDERFGVLHLDRTRT